MSRPFPQPFPLSRHAHGGDRTVSAPDLAVRLICRDCQENPPNLVEEYSSGDIVCGSCGLVLDDRIIAPEREWRNIPEVPEEPSRVGTNWDRLGVGLEDLTTTISTEDESKLSRTLHHLNEHKSNSERHLGATLDFISQKGAQMQLPSTIVAVAKQLYCRINQENTLNRRLQKHYEATVGACLFIACRQEHVSRSFIEISRIMSVEKKDVGHAFKEIVQMFDLESGSGRVGENIALGSRPQELLVRFCNYLDLPENVSSLSINIVDKLQTEVAISKSPLTIAGAAIYFASHLLGCPRTLEQIEQVVPIKKAPVARLYQTMYDIRWHLVDGAMRFDRLPVPKSGSCRLSQQENS